MPVCWCHRLCERFDCSIKRFFSRGRKLCWHGLSADSIGLAGLRLPIFTSTLSIPLVRRAPALKKLQAMGIGIFHTNLIELLYTFFFWVLGTSPPYGLPHRCVKNNWSNQAHKETSPEHNKCPHPTAFCQVVAQLCMWRAMTVKKSSNFCSQIAGGEIVILSLPPNYVSNMARV